MCSPAPILLLDECLLLLPVPPTLPTPRPNSTTHESIIFMTLRTTLLRYKRKLQLQSKYHVHFILPTHKRHKDANWAQTGSPGPTAYPGPGISREIADNVSKTATTRRVGEDQSSRSSNTRKIISDINQSPAKIRCRHPVSQKRWVDEARGWRDRD